MLFVVFPIFLTGKEFSLKLKGMVCQASEPGAPFPPLFSGALYCWYPHLSDIFK